MEGNIPNDPHIIATWISGLDKSGRENRIFHSAHNRPSLTSYIEPIRKELGLLDPRYDAEFRSFTDSRNGLDTYSFELKYSGIDENKNQHVHIFFNNTKNKWEWQLTCRAINKKGKKSGIGHLENKRDDFIWLPENEEDIKTQMKKWFLLLKKCDESFRFRTRNMARTESGTKWLNRTIQKDRHGRKKSFIELNQVLRNQLINMICLLEKL